jgi:iron complex outermembrane receptor protein
MDKKNLVAQAVRLALAAGMAGVVSVTPTYAQDEVAVQEKITITGSRISRAQAEGPAPVSVMNGEYIDASGQRSVA